MKKIMLAFIILPVIVQTAFAQSDYTFQDSVITASSIRPNDVLANDIRWNRASTDFYTYWIDNGLFGLYGPQPKVLVDGLPIDANFFGWQNLNMLPINDSKSINYSFEPQVHNSVVSPAGYLDYRSRPVKPGFSADLSYYAGNETGDPGPYNYDSQKVTPNIDRWGPDVSASLAYRKNQWYAKGLLLFRNHHPTDLAMNSRLHFTASILGTNTSYVNHIIYDSTRTAMLETGYTGDKLQVKARAAYGWNEDYVFLQPFGHEIPSKTQYQQIAVQSDYETGNWTFTGRYIDHQKSIDKRIALHPYIFDWTQRSHTVGLSTQYKSEEVSLKPGLTYELLDTEAPGFGNHENKLSTLYLATSIPTSRDDSLNARLSADYDNHNVAKTLEVSFPQTLNSAWKLTPSFIYTEVLPIRQQSFTYWVNRGYTFADKLGIPYSDTETLQQNRATIYQLKNVLHITPDISLTIEPSYIQHESLNIPFQKVREAEYLTDTKPGPFTVTQEKGSRFQLFSELKYVYRQLFIQSFSVNSQRTASGNERYKSYFNQIPDTKIQYKLDVYPTPDLILSLNALYRSSTNWDEFQAIDGNHYHLPNGIPIREFTGTFHTQTPAYTNISLGLQKWFLGRTLHAQFSLNNLLNQEIRMHPLGANLATKFEIKAGIQF